jgi:hypothetical protein
MGGFMNYADEICSVTMIYIPSFIKIGSGFQKLIGGDSQIHRQHGDRISLILFVQNKENRFKITFYCREKIAFHWI